MKSYNKRYCFFIFLLFGIAINSQADCPYCEWESKHVCDKCLENLDLIQKSLKSRLKTSKKHALKEKEKKKEEEEKKKKESSNISITPAPIKSALSATAATFVSQYSQPKSEGKATIRTGSSEVCETTPAKAIETNKSPKDKKHSPTSNRNIIKLMMLATSLRHNSSLLDAGANWIAMLRTAFSCAYFQNMSYSFWIHVNNSSHWVLINIEPEGYAHILNYKEKPKKSFQLTYSPNIENTFRNLFTYLEEEENILAGYL